VPATHSATAQSAAPSRPTSKGTLGELRPEPKTLERVFRDLAQRAGADAVDDAALAASTTKPAGPGGAAVEASS
jgi:hypothetical protein